MRKLTPLRIVGAVLRTLNPKVKPVSHKELGGTARLDSLRPEPHRGIAGAARWLGYAIIFPGALCWIAVTSPETSPPWLELSLVALMLLGSRFMVRQAKESTSGLLGFSWRTVQDRGPLAAALALITLTLIIRLIASGLPSSIDGTLYNVGSYLFLASCVVGLYSSWAVSRSLVRMRRDEYARMHEWGNPVSGKLKAAVGLPITSPEMHALVHFELDQVIIDPVPPLIAERFAGIELAMARGHVDDVMLSEDSTPQRICFVPITPEWLERRKLLRSSDFTLLGFDEREIEDADILGRNLIVAPDAVNPDASKPTKPRAASAAEHVSEKDFGQIQRFAMDATDSMTIVGYDLHRYNSDTRRYEKLIYVQRVTAEEKVILERIANLLKPKIWEMWLEFHWVPNDEDDRGEHPQRIDSVVVKRSPVGGLTPEQREQIWRPVIAMMPKGSNGWVIEDDQQSGFVTLRYGKKLSLPDLFRTVDTLPSTSSKNEWMRIPIGVNSSGQSTCLDLSNVPHSLIAGGTNSGKSTLLRQDMISRIARGHDVIVIDTVKFATDLATMKPWTLMWGETILESANILALVYEESVRRRQVIKKHKIGNWAALSSEILAECDIRPLTIFYDEYENSIVAKDVPKSLPKEHPIVANALAHNSAVDYIRSYMPQLAKEARSVGIFLVVATQTPHSVRIGDALRGNLGASMQLKAPGSKLEAHIVKLAMGEGTAQVMEQFGIFENGNKGLAVLLNEGGAPEAIRVGFASEMEAPEILARVGVPIAKPWTVRDVLELHMVLTVDDDDTRERVEPPFSLLTHLGQKSEQRSTTPLSNPEPFAPARSKLAELFGE